MADIENYGFALDDSAYREAKKQIRVLRKALRHAKETFDDIHHLPNDCYTMEIIDDALAYRRKKS